MLSHSIKIPEVLYRTDPHRCGNNVLIQISPITLLVRNSIFSYIKNE